MPTLKSESQFHADPNAGDNEKGKYFECLVKNNNNKTNILSPHSNSLQLYQSIHDINRSFNQK